MYIKKTELDTLLNHFNNFTPSGEAFKALSKEEQKSILDVEVVLLHLCKRLKKYNEHQWAMIRKKRETNPNYGRPRKEWHKIDRV